MKELNKPNLLNQRVRERQSQGQTEAIKGSDRDKQRVRQRQSNGQTEAIKRPDRDNQLLKTNPDRGNQRVRQRQSNGIIPKIVFRNQEIPLAKATK